MSDDGQNAEARVDAAVGAGIVAVATIGNDGKIGSRPWVLQLSDYSRCY